MFFFKQNGKQQLDLSGNLILTRNEHLIRAKSKINAPRKTYNANFIKMRKLGFFGRIKATIIAVRFIWQSLK